MLLAIASSYRESYPDPYPDAYVDAPATTHERIDALVREFRATFPPQRTFGPLPTETYDEFTARVADEGAADDAMAEDNRARWREMLGYDGVNRGEAFAAWLCKYHECSPVEVEVIKIAEPDDL